MNRTDCEVAARAIIYGTLGFRASLEVTEHSRTRALCSQLLPWLEQLGLGAQMDEYCAYCLTVRHQFQLLLLPPDAQTTLSSIHQTRLAELGLSEVNRRMNGFEVEASWLASTLPSVKGLYVVRAMTAKWLLSKDAPFLAESEDLAGNELT